MDRCPQCHRFGVEFDPYTQVDRCLWNDCRWTELTGIFKKFKKQSFKKFRDAIKLKK